MLTYAYGSTFAGGSLTRRMPTYADVCRRMLTYAHSSTFAGGSLTRRMLTYAEGMLTYAVWTQTADDKKLFLWEYGIGTAPMKHVAEPWVSLSLSLYLSISLSLSLSLFLSLSPSLSLSLSLSLEHDRARALSLLRIYLIYILYRLTNLSVRALLRTDVVYGS